MKWCLLIGNKLASSNKNNHNSHNNHNDNVKAIH